MLPGRLARSAAALLTTALTTALTTVFVVVSSWLMASPAMAQKPVPPSYDELNAPRPWTYLMAMALLAATVAMILLGALVYLLKGRDFRANQRRGGTK